jgi:hypothetical protein
MRENITIFGLLSLANFTEDDVLQVLSVQGYIYLLAFFLKKKIQDAFAHLLGSYTTPLTFLLPGMFLASSTQRSAKVRTLAYPCGSVWTPLQDGGQ